VLPDLEDVRETCVVYSPTTFDLKIVVVIDVAG
jgi:hypothetical protein